MRLFCPAWSGSGASIAAARTRTRGRRLLELGGCGACFGAGETIVISESCWPNELCGCKCIRRPSAYIGERRAACSEGVRQRAPTVPVAIVVDCPRLKIGLAVSIETWPELLGVGVLAAKKRS